MDAGFLARAGCFFGGGTQLAMALGEYRESRDIDFLCSGRDGVRALRETVTDRSLGGVLRRELELLREVRTDRETNVRGHRELYARVAEGLSA